MRVCAYQCGDVTEMNKYDITKFRFIVLLYSCTYYWINIKFILNKFSSRLEDGSGFILCNIKETMGWKLFFLKFNDVFFKKSGVVLRELS